MLLEEKRMPEKLLVIEPQVHSLYYDGDLKILDKPMVTIVGSRNPTRYGKQMTQLLVEKLIKHDIVIVSGFARGIDYEAHRWAIDAGGETLAVLGCGLDYPYPRHKESLLSSKEKILRLTEYGNGVSPRPEHFPRRNRILSALGDVVVVIECERKSGTMITAHHAIEQGKDLFCLPGDIRNIQAQGPNFLISQGAFPIISVEDVEKEIVRRICE